MCTATWIRNDAGFEVFFNRDELKSRKPALPPSPRVRDGVRFLAPEDGDAGGTWIGVNERGVVLGLANGPVPAPGTGLGADAGERAFRSRGLLVLDLLSSAALGEVEERLVAADWRTYRPFALFAIDRDGASRLWGFDGSRLAHRRDGEDGVLVLTSSRDAERARRERGRLLDLMVRANGGLDARLLLAFHASHEPERALSPCMHREDASTVSFARIRVGRDAATFEYYDAPPCEHARPVTSEVPLR